MKVSATAFETELDGDYGIVPGIEVTCSKCGHYVEVYGTDTPSYDRAAIMLRKECPENERNYYEVS